MMTMKTRKVVCALWVLCMGLPTLASAQDSAMQLTRFTGAIALDGVPDEATWLQADPLPLTMYFPTFEGTPTERTEIRVGYDDRFLYAAGWFYDSDPEGIRINSLYRDRWNGDDAFAIYVDEFLADVAEVEIVAEAVNGRDAVAKVREHAPDLVFLDVQMPDMDGFAVLEELGPDVPRGIVLVTAHDEYAQRAFEVHAVDYVMKPFGRPRFMAAVERAVRRLEADDALGMQETLRSLVQSLRPSGADTATLLGVDDAAASAPARLGVRVGSRTTLIEIEDIDWLEADRDLVKVHSGQKVHLVSGRMKDFESRLGSGRFHRIHRSAIVNLDRVRVLDRDRDGGGSVVLASGVRLRVARGRWEELEQALGLEFKG
jgi:two-component system, LytTR family, response regulator